MRLLLSLGALGALTRVAHALSSGLTTVSGFVAKSSDVAMYAYIPQPAPTGDVAVVVAVHSCERSAEYYYLNTGYAALADQYGYIVIYPNASTESGCWDVTTPQSTTRNGGGNSQDIADMVAYATANYNGNASRVAVTGSSSGGVMVQLLAGIYPDVFQAASVFSGLYSDDYWSGYTGSRPKIQIWHGTNDTTYNYANLAIELNGWSGVLDVTFSRNITDDPQSGYTKMIYGDGLKLVGYSALNVGHTVPVDTVTDLAWFCIEPACGPDGLPIVVTSTTSSSTATATSASSSGTAPATGDATSTSSPTGSETGDKTTETSPAASDSIVAKYESLSSGAKVGISVGVVGAAIAFLLMTTILCYKRQQRKRNFSTLPPTVIPMTSREAVDGHEYHSGYGAVPGGQAASQSGGMVGISIGDRQAQLIENRHAHSFPEPPSPTFSAPRYPGDPYRDSTGSSFMMPGGQGYRDSVTSGTYLLPGAAGDHRFSTASSATGLGLSRPGTPGSPVSPGAEFRHGTLPLLSQPRSPDEEYDLSERR